MQAPRTVREMTQLLRETQKNGNTNKSKRTNKHAKHKPKLNKYKKTHSAQLGCMNWSWQLCTWKTSNVQRKCQGPLQLLSPLFLMASTMKQMRPNGKGEDTCVCLITSAKQLYYLHLCLSVCSQDYSKTTDQICMKFYGMVGHNPGNQSIRF